DHVHVWDAATGRAVATLAPVTLPSPPGEGEEARVRGPRLGATSAAFAPDGRTLATASADGIVRLWEVATWKVRAQYPGHRDRVTAVAFGPDGRLFTGGLGPVVLGWDVRPPPPPPRPPPPGGEGRVRGPAKGSLAHAWNALASHDARSAF